MTSSTWHLCFDSCRVDRRALPQWLPHRGGWLPSLGDSSSTAMAVRLVSVLHFYPLFSCEQIPFVFEKHVMEMIVTVVWLYIIIIKLKMSDLMTKMYKSSMISNWMCLWHVHIYMCRLVCMPVFFKLFICRNKNPAYTRAEKSSHEILWAVLIQFNIIRCFPYLHLETAQRFCKDRHHNVGSPTLKGMRPPGISSIGDDPLVFRSTTWCKSINV